MKILFALCVGLLSGFIFSEYRNIQADLVCNDYYKRDILWEGHVSYRGEHPRCFYRESVYPHRVWNGTTVK